MKDTTFTAIFTCGIFLVSCFRAYVEYQTYKTEWWKDYQETGKKPPS